MAGLQDPCFACTFEEVTARSANQKSCWLSKAEKRTEPIRKSTAKQAVKLSLVGRQICLALCLFLQLRSALNTCLFDLLLENFVSENRIFRMILFSC
jgi:hypothetical protein